MSVISFWNGLPPGGDSAGCRKKIIESNEFNIEFVVLDFQLVFVFVE